jgi:membrane protease subunit HflK
MGLNNPDKNKDPKNKDPWSDKSQPPDLDEAIKRFQKQLKAFFSPRKEAGGSEQSNKSIDGSGSGFLVAGLLGVIFILWFLSGVFIVNPAEKAVILRLGHYVETVGPGPHWIPRLIDTKTLVNVDRISDYSYSAQMLTKDENLVSVAVAVQYRIGSLEQYLFNVADPEESLQQATSSALRQVVGATTLDQILTEGREAWGANVQEALINILKNYKLGIRIVNVSPQPARAPDSVQDAFDDAIKAQEDEKRFKEQARAYEARVVPIAMGNAKRIEAEAKAYAEQVVFQAKGETAEFLAILPAYITSPGVIGPRMYFDTMQNVFGKTSKILVDSKSGNLLYLPLAQLIKPKTKVDETQASGVSPINQDDAKSINETFEGRMIVRPTENMRGTSR